MGRTKDQTRPFRELLDAPVNADVQRIADILLHCMNDEQCYNGWNANYCFICQEWAIEKAVEIKELK